MSSEMQCQAGLSAEATLEQLAKGSDASLTNLSRMIGSAEGIAKRLDSLREHLLATGAWTGESAQLAIYNLGVMKRNFEKLASQLEARRQLIERHNDTRRSEAWRLHGELPSGLVPGYVHDALSRNDVTVQTPFGTFSLDEGVEGIANAFGNHREKEAQNKLSELRSLIQSQRSSLDASNEDQTWEKVKLADGSDSDSPKTAPPPQNYTPTIPPYPGGGPSVPGGPGFPGPGDPVRPGPGFPGPGDPVRPGPGFPGPGDPVRPGPGDPGDGSGDGNGSNSGGGNTSVDSGMNGGGGTSGLGVGLAGGGLGAAGIAAGAKLAGFGGAGGLGAAGLGVGGAGAGGAGAASGGLRGSGGLAGGATGAGNAAGGAGNGSGAGGRGGGMMGGAGAGAGGAEEKKKKGGAGLGYLAPKFEDEGDGGPAADASRAGSRSDD